MGKDQIPRHILILDDDPDYRKLLLMHLGELLPGVELTEYDPLAQGVPGSGFDWSRFDVLLLDYNLALDDVTGLDILKTHGGDPAFPATIMLTGAGSEDLAITVMRSGLSDYLRKQKLNKAQLKQAILEAHARHIAARQQKDAIDEVRKAASKAAAKAFAEYKSRYENLHAAEIGRLQEELSGLSEELQKSRQLLRAVESEKQGAVQSLEDIEQELMKFRKGAAGRGREDLKEHNEKRDQLQKGIEDSERKLQNIEGEIQKNLWRQGQEQMKLEQIEEDLRLFNEEFSAGQKGGKELSSTGEFQKLKKARDLSRKSERQKKEQDMYSDVSSQLGEDKQE